MLWYLITSEQQMYRVWVLETPFYLVLRLLQVYTFVTIITYNHLLRCVTFTHLTILHPNIPFLTSSRIHASEFNCKLHASKSNQSHIATNGQSVSKSWCRAPSGTRD
jgi:hypothetical protein